MSIKSEKQLLNFVKYSPIIIILIVAILINIFIYIQNENNFQKDLEIYKKNYIESNKKLIKFQVDKVYENIQRKRASLEYDLEAKIKHRINNALNTIKNIHQKYSHLPKVQIIDLIKESLRTIRFDNGRSYFYLTKPNGYILLHPVNSSYENTNISNIQDKDGTYIYKDLIEYFKTNNEFLGYIKATKPNSSNNKKYEKLTYIKKYEPLNILVGTGDYKDSFTMDMQKYIIEEYIQNVWYGKNGYIFVFDYNGYQLAHANHEYIGKQRINLTDSNGFMITKEIIKEAKKGSGFINYISSILPGTEKSANKTTYVKGVDDWGWAIGSGFYDFDLLKYLESKKEELRKQTNESLKKTLIISSILTIILISLAFYVSNILKKFFKRFHEQIEKEIKENRKKDVLLHQQSKMASMGEMLGNIAHQWRQPLSSVSTIASGTKIQKELGMLKDSDFDKGMDTIVETTKHLSQTIDDFRDFFNPNRTKKEVSTQLIYNKSIQLVSSRLTSKEIELKSDIDDIKLITYENELLQVVINILNNAIDAFDNNDMQNKLIEFNIKFLKECKMPSCDIKECSQREYGYITITIHDNAGGISKEHITKVFDAYFTTKYKSQGTGIGLYMAYEIINKHLKGDISVKNTKIKYKDKNYLGAKFTIFLPIKVEEE